MTDTSQPRPETDVSTAGRQVPDYPPRREAPAATGGAVWVVFAGVMAILLGIFQVILGLVALFDPGFYLVARNGLVVSVDYNVWGWVHLAIGVVAILVGLGLIVGNTAARIVGVIIAGLSAVINLVFLTAYPIWSVIVIVLDVIVIYAILVHGRELKA